MSPIPIACSLSSSERDVRKAQWSQFLETGVVEKRHSGASTRLRLADREDVIFAAVDLARRERECCAFFEFHLDVLPDGIWLRILAPPGARSLVEALLFVQ